MCLLFSSYFFFFFFFCYCLLSMSLAVVICLYRSEKAILALQFCVQQKEKKIEMRDNGCNSNGRIENVHMQDDDSCKLPYTRPKRRKKIWSERVLQSSTQTTFVNRLRQTRVYTFLLWLLMCTRKRDYNNEALEVFRFQYIELMPAKYWMVKSAEKWQRKKKSEKSREKNSNETSRNHPMVSALFLFHTKFCWFF